MDEEESEKLEAYGEVQLRTQRSNMLGVCR